MLQQLKSWWSGKVKFEGDFATKRLCFEAAIKAGVELREVDLTGMVLTGAVLTGADLTGADLTDGISKKLFGEMGKASGQSGSVDRAIYAPWLAKAGERGCKRMLEVLLEGPERTKTQLATLAGVSPKSGTFFAYLRWLRTNGLTEEQGDVVKLRAV